MIQEITFWNTRYFVETLNITIHSLKRPQKKFDYLKNTQVSIIISGSFVFTIYMQIEETNTYLYAERVDILRQMVTDFLKISLEMTRARDG